MKLKELESAGKIKPQKVGANEILAAISKAESDLSVAKEVIEQSNDWGFAIAYNAALQAARSYMFACGYRPAVREGHKNTFLFIQAKLGKDHETLVTYLDRARVKRNETVYDISGTITETEAQNLLKHAENFIEIILQTKEIKISI